MCPYKIFPSCLKVKTLRKGKRYRLDFLSCLSHLLLFTFIFHFLLSFCARIFTVLLTEKRDWLWGWAHTGLATWLTLWSTQVGLLSRPLGLQASIGRDQEETLIWIVSLCSKFTFQSKEPCLFLERFPTLTSSPHNRCLPWDHQHQSHYALGSYLPFSSGIQDFSGFSPFPESTPTPFPGFIFLFSRHLLTCFIFYFVFFSVQCKYLFIHCCRWTVTSSRYSKMLVEWTQ